MKLLKLSEVDKGDATKVAKIFGAKWKGRKTVGSLLRK